MTSSLLDTVLEVVGPFVPEGVALTPDLPLLETDVVDSASMVNILLDLEARLNVTLTAADLSFDHFHSCRTLADALQQRLDA